ncbi:ABC transporter permease [Lentilactobacillus diolivorans]|uniref:ABC transporter permease n=1 Tax=Lentilactobacillus diolivorans TaxID=179838 RepID=UPI0024695E30|nr:ABC transporter permease [Lentilactobacillus diolivorans]MDH5105597.1 ABC transporter permease [Lentilactobacillus diolivorans]
MTSFSSVTKILSKQKIQIVNHVIVLDLIAVILSIFWAIYQGSLTAIDSLSIILGWSVVAFMVAFVLLSRNSEHVFVSDSYRLIPTNDTNLYTANLISSILGIVYLGVFQILLFAISSALNLKQIMLMLNKVVMNDSVSVFSMRTFWGVVSVLIAILFFTILFWTSITLIHMITTAIISFLPDNRQKIVRFILYVVVIIGLVYVLSILSNTVGNFIGQFGNPDSYLYAYTADAFVAFVVLLESVGSIYLLQNWVETNN